MKYSNKRDRYENAGTKSNLTVSTTNGVAHSYGWYEIAKRIGKNWVVNVYNYSPTTCKHHYKIREFITQELGASEYICVESPRGLQDLQSAVDLYESRIKNLETAMATPRTQAKKNLERASEIASIKKQIKLVQALIRKAA